LIIIILSWYFLCVINLSTFISIQVLYCPNMENKIVPKRHYGLPFLVGSIVFTGLSIAGVVWNEELESKKRRKNLEADLRKMQQRENRERLEFQRKLEAALLESQQKENRTTWCFIHCWIVQCFLCKFNCRQWLASKQELIISFFVNVNWKSHWKFRKMHYE